MTQANETEKHLFEMKASEIEVMLSERRPILDAYKDMKEDLKEAANTEAKSEDDKQAALAFGQVLDGVFDMAVAFYNVALAIGFQRAKEELDNGNNGSGGVDREGEGERSERTGAGVSEAGGCDHPDQGEQGDEPEGLREPA